MSESQKSVIDTVKSWNKDGRLYVVFGVISATLSLVYIPLFGLVAVYFGYKTYDTQQKLVLPILMAGLGGFGFLFWVYYLTTL